MHVDTEKESLMVETECVESSSNSSNCDNGATTNQWSPSGKVLRHKIHKKTLKNTQQINKFQLSDKIVLWIFLSFLCFFLVFLFVVFALFFLLLLHTEIEMIVETKL